MLTPVPFLGPSTIAVSRRDGANCRSPWATLAMGHPAGAIRPHSHTRSTGCVREMGRRDCRPTAREETGPPVVMRRQTALTSRPTTQTRRLERHLGGGGRCWRQPADLPSYRPP